MGPGSAEQRHSASKTRVNALVALHHVRDTKCGTPGGSQRAKENTSVANQHWC